MNNVPQREREPELKECLMALENLSSRYDGLTLDLRNKVRAIYNAPELEAANKMDTEPSKPDDMVGCINEQIKRLTAYSNRLEDLLGKLHRIV